MMPELFLLLWWLFWLCPWRTFSYKWQYGIYMSLALLLLYTGIATLGVYYDERYPLTHLQKDCLVYIGPDVTYSTYDALQQGDRVRVIKKHEQWRKVCKDNLTGWVEADCVEQVD